MEEHNYNTEPFWTNYLKNFTANSYLKYKIELTENTSDSYDYYYHELSKDDTDKLKECARNLQISLNSLIQGAWAVLLSQFCQTEDVIFGVTVSGRNIDLPHVQEIVGLLINTLPLRVKIDKNQKLTDFFHDLQINMAEINNNSCTSLAKIKSYANSQNHEELFNNITFNNFN